MTREQQAWMQAAPLIQRWQDAARRTVRQELAQKKMELARQQSSQGRR